MYIRRVGQSRIYTPYMTVYMVISLPKIPYTHCIYMVLANPIHTVFLVGKSPNEPSNTVHINGSSSYKLGFLAPIFKPHRRFKISFVSCLQTACSPYSSALQLLPLYVMPPIFDFFIFCLKLKLKLKLAS